MKRSFGTGLISGFLTQKIRQRRDEIDVTNIFALRMSSIVRQKTKYNLKRLKKVGFIAILSKNNL